MFIESNRGDVLYRYKMPKLVTKIERRGNCDINNVFNMLNVAEALAGTPLCITK
uniref:Uncharacterized protein n=2 Tax=Physcomitrium patens TaxID=3218 RepID=A0A2K1IIY5_PHYPA|nr:hypothetical protein PHYPA_027921 [Physcomitrium patens]